MLKSSSYNIVSLAYEAPSLICCMVHIEKGYSLTSQFGDIENLGGSKEEGDW